MLAVVHAFIVAMSRKLRLSHGEDRALLFRRFAAYLEGSLVLLPSGVPCPACLNLLRDIG